MTLTDDNKIPGPAPDAKNQDLPSPQKPEEKSWAFDIAAIILAIIAATFFYTGLLRDNWQFLLVCTIAAIASMCFLVWPEVLKRRGQDFKTMNQNLAMLERTMGNIDDVKREHNRARASYDRAKEAWENGAKELALGMENAIKHFGTGGDAQSQLMQLRQEAGEWSRHVDEWHEKLVEFVDFLDRGLDMENVDESTRGKIGRIRAELIKTLDTLGLHEISPKPGDAFDRKRHRAEGVQEVEGLKPGAVASVLQTGYATGRKIIRPAIVRLTSGGEA